MFHIRSAFSCSKSTPQGEKECHASVVHMFTDFARQIECHRLTSACHQTAGGLYHILVAGTESLVPAVGGTESLMDVFGVVRSTIGDSGD